MTTRLDDLHRILGRHLRAEGKSVRTVVIYELAALMKSCAGKDFRDRRDEAIIRLLLDCGLRVSELCTLTVQGTDLDQGMAIVQGKGRKVRPIYFGARTTRALDRYIRARSRERWAHLDALFITQRGSLSPDGRLGADDRPRCSDRDHRPAPAQEGVAVDHHRYEPNAGRQALRHHQPPLLGKVTFRWDSDYSKEVDREWRICNSAGKPRASYDGGVSVDFEKEADWETGEFPPGPLLSTRKSRWS
jgi:hypothetical protein